ncbi:MAG TPA: FtsX-like permease family protein [Pseudomonadales bacterium]
MKTDWSLAYRLGVRFATSTRGKGFLTLVSWISLLGMVLGVSALIVVMSVMNGFHAEIRDRLLVLVPQWRVESALAGDLNLASQERLQALLPNVLLSPYIQGTVLISSEHGVRGAKVLGVDPAREPALLDRLAHADTVLAPGAFQMVLGRGLARQLEVGIGDRVTLVLPQVSVTPAGVFPRTRNFRVSDILATGSQADTEYAIIPLQDAQRLFRMSGTVHGFRLHTAEPVANVLTPAQLGDAGWSLSNWRSLQGALFDAVAMEKRMISLLLFVVVIVAGFNIVAMLAISVSRKQPAIAILKTLGASRQTIMASFVIQGFMLASVGIASGCVLGLLLAWNLNSLVHAVESALHQNLFDPTVFYIVDLPVDIQGGDMLAIVGGAWALALLACLIPARQAARMNPADGLRP